MKLNIIGDYNVWKIHERVFQVGELPNDVIFKNKDFFSVFISILNKGNKFIPCFYINELHFFKNLINNFEKNIDFLNKQFFFKNITKNVNSLSNNNNISNSVNLEINNCIPLENDNEINIETINLEENIKNFIKSGKKNINYPVQNETCDFQLNFYKSLSHENKDNLFKNNFNFTKEEFLVLKEFLEKKPFKVIDSDKNVGPVIISHSLYEELCLKSLNSDNFTLLENNPLDETINKIMSKLDELRSENLISLSLFNKLKPKVESKNGKFRILSKLHKQKFGTRPIINCIDHPTESLSQFVDKILQPHIKKLDPYIRLYS